MKAFPSLVVALLFLNLLSADATLEETCKQLAAHTGVHFDVNFCITTLQVVPGSNEADAIGLTSIIANLANANITHNLAKVKELLNSKNVSAESKKALDVCEEVYDLGIEDIKETIEALESRNFFTVKSRLSALLFNVFTCRDAWAESKLKSLMPKEEDDAYKISDLAVSIGASLPDHQ
ncbi:uncharacterized protein A4U43_C06F3230 [Asparagus officinalis]|uniref:Pectinesterase inhibitor domain-containing protein n=1 Tax=Asparagus officinalis TaxID=4686 RepID=A0A5P1EJ60_ASPOF|nr:uncharacterized protein LOC109845270 [Asparagus officinalis]ONK66008.1 uncharacterized protein A4U43_C06F3230 [Asparagus officinalis]